MEYCCTGVPCIVIILFSISSIKTLNVFIGNQHITHEPVANAYEPVANANADVANANTFAHVANAYAHVANAYAHVANAYAHVTNAYARCEYLPVYRSIMFRIPPVAP